MYDRAGPKAEQIQMSPGHRIAEDREFWQLVTCTILVPDLDDRGEARTPAFSTLGAMELRRQSPSRRPKTLKYLSWEED